ncbi:unnamed protein product, partial [Pylaiella littoralis]
VRCAQSHSCSGPPVRRPRGGVRRHRRYHEERLLQRACFGTCDGQAIFRDYPDGETSTASITPWGSDGVHDKFLVSLSLHGTVPPSRSESST